jgi:hypothetical protein
MELAVGEIVGVYQMVAEERVLILLEHHEMKERLVYVLFQVAEHFRKMFYRNIIYSSD